MVMLCCSLWNVHLEISTELNNIFNGRSVESHLPDHSCTAAGTFVHLSVCYFPQASISLPVVDEEAKSEGVLN